MLLVDRDDEPARVGMVAGADLGEPRVSVAQHAPHPVPAAVERRAQTTRVLRTRQHDREVRAAALAVAHPLHVAVVGDKGDRPADPVDQRVGVRVGVVGGGEAVGVVLDPRDRRVVGAERRAAQQQSQLGAREGVHRRDAPARVLAHVVGLVGDQQRAPLCAGVAVRSRAGSDRLIRDRNAVTVGRLGPLRVRAIRLEVNPVAGRVGRPLARDVRSGGEDRDALHPTRLQHLVRDAQPERRLAGGRCRGGEERLPVVRGQRLQRRLLPRAQRPARRPRRQQSPAGDGAHASISERPVISAGCASPSTCRTVGATSARIPPSRSSKPGTVTISGTGLSECAVLGEPSSSSMWSALPWSAVMMQAPPDAWTASTSSPRQRSTVSIAVTAAGITPVWPTMSALAKLMMPKRGWSSCQARTNAAAASGALIWGLWSYVGTSRGEATSSRRSPAYGVSSPPLKKYVTCGYFSVSAT